MSTSLCFATAIRKSTFNHHALIAILGLMALAFGCNAFVVGQLQQGKETKNAQEAEKPKLPDAVIHVTLPTRRNSIGTPDKQ